MSFDIEHEEIEYQQFVLSDYPVQISARFKSRDNEGNVVVRGLRVNFSSDDACYNSQAVSEVLRVVQLGLEIDRLSKTK